MRIRIHPSIIVAYERYLEDAGPDCAGTFEDFLIGLNYPHVQIGAAPVPDPTQPIRIDEDGNFYSVSSSTVTLGRAIDAQRQLLEESTKALGKLTKGQDVHTELRRISLVLRTVASDLETACS